MLRRMTMTILLILTLTATVFAADDIKSAFKEGKLYGQFRTYYFTRDFDVSNTREDIAAGGMLYYRTAPLYGINLGVAFYTAQGMGLNDDDKDVYGLLASGSDGNHESFAVLGESFIQVTRWDSSLKIGRQELETPWINTDDNRLTPQSTESYTFTNNSVAGLEIFASQVTKMRGKTSTDFDSMTKFAGITTDDKPVTVGGITFSGVEGLKVQLWDFYAHDFLNDIYSRVDYSRTITDNFSGSVAFQYLNQGDVGDKLGGTVDTDTYAVEGGIEGYGFNFSLAYARVGDQDLIYPWGHDLIISAQVNDCARADETGIQAILGYDLGKIGLKGLSAKVVYVDFDTPETGVNASPDIDETDFDVKYKFDGYLKGLGLRARYAIIDKDEAMGGEDFTDFRLYCTYDFSM